MASADVLIIAALPEEFDAARQVGESLGIEWHYHARDAYLAGELTRPIGPALTVALARPTRMGGRTTGPVIAVLAQQLQPTCLAMCGVCAGNPSRTALGDVVVAELVYAHDEGMVTASEFIADHRQYPLNDQWLRAVQDYAAARTSPTGGPFRVVVGPIASGAQVVRDPGMWNRLAAMGVRTVAALEMEAASIATVAHQQGVAHWLVAKGVMDHADAYKDDRYKTLAATASAEVLFALLMRLAEHREPTRSELVSSARDAIAERSVRDLVELEKRTMRGPRRLPTAWRGAGGRQPVDGDRLAGVFPHLDATFEATSHRQLVVLGDAGSGKSALVGEFALRAAKRAIAEPDAPIPVLVPMWVWNTGGATLGTLITDWLRRRFGAVLSRCRVRAVDLYEDVAFLPILDGFDELRHPARQHALDMLSVADTQFILTSRPGAFPAQWRPHVDVVEIEPLRPSDVRTYLTGRADNHPGWSAFYARVDAQPDDAAVRSATAALLTPLGAALADEVYGNHATRRSATELLSVRPQTQQAVLDHLIDASVDVAFDPRLGRSGGHNDDQPPEPGRPRRRWQRAAEARQWLAVVAVAQRLAAVPNYRWWNLERAVPAALVPTLVGLVAGTAAGLGSAYNYGTRYAVLNALVLGLCGAAIAAGAGVALHETEPSDAALIERERAELRNLRGATIMQRRLAFLAVLIPLSLLFSALFYLVWIAAAEVLGADRINGWKGALPVSLVAGALTFVGGWAVFTRFFRTVTREDLTDTLLETELDPRWRFGRLPIALLITIAATAGAATPVISRVVTAWDVAAGTAAWHTGAQPSIGAVVLAAVGLAVATTTVAASMSRRFRYGVARLWLAATTGIPWNLKDFLADAAERQVLRRVGTVYEFRHEELTRRLADTGGATQRRRRLNTGTSLVLVALLGAGFIALGLWYGQLRSSDVSGSDRIGVGACLVRTSGDRIALSDCKARGAYRITEFVDGPSVCLDRQEQAMLVGSRTACVALASTAGPSGGAASAPSSPPASPAVTDSHVAPITGTTFFAVLTEVDATNRTAVLHPAEFIEGDDATAACRVERPANQNRCEETDYYVRETDAPSMTLALADGALLKEKYGGQDCADNEDGCVVTADQLARLLDQPNAGGKKTVLYVDVTVDGGRVTRMVERYTP